MSTNTQISWMLNEECIQVCIGTYQTILVFTNELTITIECDYFLESEKITLNLSGDNAEDSGHLIELLGNSIVEAIHADSCISISFSSGLKIKVEIESNGLESLSIIKKGMQIIV